MSPFNPPLTASEVQTVFKARYSALSAIKTGGQGAVFCGTIATGPMAGRKVALKVYFTDQLKERTERETNALRAITSASLVQLVGTGRTDFRGTPCVWLETAFVEGDSLAGRIAAAPLSVQATSRIAAGIAEAIEAIWTPHRIVHRDIKPDNIMVTPEGRAVLIDLGVARHTALSALTTYGTAWGTQGYMSPEQAMARRSLTCHSDIFALGIVVQQSILGRHPTNGDQDMLMNGGPSTAPLKAGLRAEFVALVDEMVQRRSFLRPSPQVVAERLQPFTA